MKIVKNMVLLILLLPFLFNLLNACDPYTPRISYISVLGHSFSVGSVYNCGAHHGDLINAGILKASSRQVNVNTGEMWDDCGHSRVYAGFYACNMDLNDCKMQYGQYRTTGWVEYGFIEGYYLNVNPKFRCDVPGYCRYRFFVHVKDHTCANSDGDWYDIIGEFHNGLGNQAAGVYGIIIVPGAPVFTKIIPVYTGELSTHYIPVYIQDSGIDTNSYYSCNLYGSSSTGSVSVPYDASKCHTSNKKEGPYQIKCGNGDYGKCTLKRTLSVGTNAVSDKKEFYIYGIDKILVKQNVDKPGDEVLTFSSIDTMSNDINGPLGGVHYFVKYNGKYFDLIPTHNVIKGGSKKVKNIKEVSKKFYNPRKNGQLIYASGYSSERFCKEHGYEYVKSYYISSGYGSNTIGWNKYQWVNKGNYYYFTMIECGKTEIEYQPVDTYPNTNNMIAYDTHHLQWFNGLGKKIVEITGTKEDIDELYDKITMIDVKNFKKERVSDTKIRMEFEELDPINPEYKFQIKEDPATAYGKYNVRIYPEKYPQFVEEFELEWISGKEKEIAGKKVLISIKGTGFAIAPIDYDKEYLGSLGVTSNEKILVVPDLNSVSNIVLKNEGTELYVSSSTDPLFPKYLIPGDKINIKTALFKEFGSSNKITFNIELKTSDGDLVYKNSITKPISDGYNEYTFSIILPSTTKTGKVYFGKGLVLSVEPSVSHNIGELHKVINSLMSMDDIRIHLEKVRNGKYLVVLPDGVLLEPNDTVTYTFDIKKDNKRLISSVRVYFRVKTNDNRVVDEWSKIYSIHPGDNIFTESWKIPERDKDGVPIYEKDLRMDLWFSIPYNKKSPTSAYYEWIRLKSSYTMVELGPEIFLPENEFKEWLANEFRRNDVRKSVYLANYNDYWINQYKKDESVKKIAVTLKIDPLVFSNPSIKQNIEEVVKNEPGVEYDITKGEFKFIVYDKYSNEDNNGYQVLFELRKKLAEYKIYWEEELNVLYDKTDNKITGELI